MRTSLLTEFMMQAPYQPATNYWRSIEVEEVIKYGLPVGRGLDLGCGDGHLMAIILGHVGQRDLVGLDVDPHETNLAARRNIYCEISTAMGDQMPFLDKQFDFVFSNSVLEHIENIDGALLEVSRVLRPGGRFLFTVPGPDFHKCLKGPRSQKNREHYLRETDARCFHLRYWNATEWSQHLQESGLQVVHQHEYLSLAEVQRWESIARNTSGVLYKIQGKRKQPIEIQRQIGIRSQRIRLPRFVASMSARLLDFGAPAADGSLCGCLLVEAVKRERAQ